MNKTFGFVMFAAGAAIGSVATWYFVKTKYEQIAQEEIDSVKEVFSKRESNPVETDIHQEINSQEGKTLTVKEYAATLNEQGYTNYSGTDDEEEIVKPIEKPYVISPDEFGEIDEYTKISLTYYADHILADDNDEFVEDVEMTVGFESLNHFGEYEDDSVFVRNDRLKADYEILLNLDKYADVVNKKPYLMTEV